MLRDNLVGLIEPMLCSAGANPLALRYEDNKPSDDRPPCLENPRPKGAESTLTENASSPFQAEPRHMVGILVHGNNHFILAGPVPDDATAVALARHWSIIQIGETKSSTWGQWQIRSKEFRENLEWVVIVPGDRDVSPGVAELLTELSTRGVPIRRCANGCW